MEIESKELWINIYANDDNKTFSTVNLDKLQSDIDADEKIKDGKYLIEVVCRKY